MRPRSPLGAAVAWMALASNLLVFSPALGAAGPPADSESLASDDLSHPFGTRSDWRFDATQAPPIGDPFGSPGDTVPGAVTLCLHRAGSATCDPQLQRALDDSSDNTLFSERHYLDRAEVVHAAGISSQSILLVVTASLHSGDGDQLVLTQALAYQAASDRFIRVYEHSTGRNNNQEVRYIGNGPLNGDIISVDPTGDAPYGFWVVVSSFIPGRGYVQKLRYRSETRYADGNDLPVIDSEMPNIRRLLGLWRAGSPLPLPAGSCPEPHLIRMELWCR